MKPTLIVFLLCLFAGCHHSTSSTTFHETSLPVLEAIDSLLWSQPDNAFVELQGFAASNEADSLDAYNGHYFQLLLSELLYKNDYAQTNREELLKAVGYFDSLAWGNRMSHNAWATTQTQVSFPFSRGFTGHEHYDRFGIINANARLYDPVIGRFFSPDPYVQVPDFTQGFNRYSYCMNNPVMFSDPDGEIFGTVFGFLSDLIDNVFVRTIKGEQWDWTQTKNGWEIDKSIFYTDPNKNKGARVWEVVSRLTWQLPQTLVGDLFVSGMNAAGRVNNITHGYGITAVDMGIGGGVTIGYFTGGPNGYTADWRDHLFVHEYGHYVQSQQHGPLYLFSVAIPSGLSALIHNKTHGSIDHRNRWFEADASYKGSAYFDKYYGSGKEGYVAGSPDFFDRYSFAFEDHSPYKNPRTGRHIQNPHPISSKFHWTDIPITGISIEVLLFLLSL